MHCAAARQAARLHLLDPEIFPLPAVLCSPPTSLQEIFEKLQQHTASQTSPEPCLPKLAPLSSCAAPSATSASSRLHAPCMPTLLLDETPSTNLPVDHFNSAHPESLFRAALGEGRPPRGLAVQQQQSKLQASSSCDVLLQTPSEVLVAAEEACKVANEAEEAAEVAKEALGKAQAALVAIRAAHSAMEVARVSTADDSTMRAIQASTLAVQVNFCHQNACIML
jgi:hypothetical protein